MSAWAALAGPLFVVTTALLDPFAFFQPTVQLRPDDRAAMAQGAPFARTVPAPRGHVAIVAAVPINIDGDRLIVWMRDIAALKRNPLMKQVGHFSAVPSVQDLQGLTLEPQDIAEIASCEPSACGVKLRAVEIARLRTVMKGASRAEASAAAQQAFREVMVARVQDYLEEGRDGATTPAFLSANWPALGADLAALPPRTMPGAESFLYWAKDAYGGKPIISITHVTMIRGTRPHEPEVLVVGRQVYATHYSDGSWSFTALMRGEQTNYLVYLNQSQIDLLDTWYGGIVRRAVERRLRAEAVDVLESLRERLESGEPPRRSTE